MSKTRTLGYVLAPMNDQIESADLQAGIIKRYCERLGRTLDGVFVDAADSGNLRMFDREAGRQLLLALRRGDHVVVARLDRLDNTLKGFTRVLDAWSKQGIVTHVLDGPLTVLDPNHPHCIVLIKILAKFAEHERRMIGQRTSQGLAAVKASGRRYCQIAPYGFAWDRCGSEMIMVPEPREQAIGAKAAEMRAEGYSIDQIRQYFAYEWKVTNRNGREFNNAAVHKMAISGAQWLSAEVPQGV